MRPCMQYELGATVPEIPCLLLRVVCSRSPPGFNARIRIGLGAASRILPSQSNSWRWMQLENVVHIDASTGRDSVSIACPLMSRRSKQSYLNPRSGVIALMCGSESRSSAGLQRSSR
jgi:hypothetical protein